MDAVPAASDFCGLAANLKVSAFPSCFRAMVISFSEIPTDFEAVLSRAGFKTYILTVCLDCTPLFFRGRLACQGVLKPVLVLQLDFACRWIMSSCAVVADSGEMLVLPPPSRPS